MLIQPALLLKAGSNTPNDPCQYSNTPIIPSSTFQSLLFDFKGGKFQMFARCRFQYFLTTKQ